MIRTQVHPTEEGFSAWHLRVFKSTPGCHLWLVLRSEEHRGGALLETACFLAIWLSGILGVAICVL